MRETWIIILCTTVVVMGAIVGCKEDLTSEECPVAHEIDKQGQYQLHGKWQFVGFYDTITGSVDPPLCGTVESWIEFTDSTHTQSGQAYKYPVVMRGTALINYFSGSYLPDTQAKQIQVSETTIKTKVRGTQQVEDFESRFHYTLADVTSYHITYNELFLVPESGSIQLRFVAVK